MTAIFAFDETDDHLPRARRNTASSINSFDDRWLHNTTTPAEDFDVHPTRFRHFGTAWDHSIIAEEDETPVRVGTPPIRIPNSRATEEELGAGSVQVDLDEDFIAAQLRGEGLDRKMVPSDFEQVRVLGKGGYGTVLLVRHKVSGRLFAQKQLKKASFVVQSKIIGIKKHKGLHSNIRIYKIGTDDS